VGLIDYSIWDWVWGAGRSLMSSHTADDKKKEKKKKKKPKMQKMKKKKTYSPTNQLIISTEWPIVSEDS
jgi:hypothetical protein